MSGQARPPCFGESSSSAFLLHPNNDKHGSPGQGLIARSEPPTERTSRLPHTTTTSTSTPPPNITTSIHSAHTTNRPPSSPTADSNILTRPLVIRAPLSVAVISTTQTNKTHPLPTRPKLLRSATTTAAFIQTHPSASHRLRATMERGNPSFLHRATQALSQQLELTSSSSYTHRNAPRAPSHWNDTPHRRYLIKLWDSIVEVTTNSTKYPSSTISQLVSTQQTMLRKFPELSEGNMPLTREWIEYVLGVALKHPFCTDEKMGRWEVLASSGGAGRMNWGPW